MSEPAIEHKGRLERLKKSIRKNVLPLTIIAAAVGAAGVGVASAAIEHHIDSPGSVTPAGIVEDIKGGTKDLVDEVKLTFSSPKPTFGGGRSGGGGASRKW